MAGRKEQMMINRKLKWKSGRPQGSPLRSSPYMRRLSAGRRDAAPYTPASLVKGRGTARRRWWDSQSPALCGARLSRHSREAIWEGQQRVSPPNLPSCLDGGRKTAPGKAHRRQKALSWREYKGERRSFCGKNGFPFEKAAGRISPPCKFQFSITSALR